MWNKIYPIALAVFVLVMMVLTYLAYSQLQSQGFAPAVIAENYQIYENYYRQFLWISSLVLLIPANALLWTQRKAWALWTTFLYFAVFILLYGWWLSSVFSDYQQKHSLSPSTISFTGLISTFICIVAAIGIFFDQFLVVRMQDRLYAAKAAEEPSQAVSTEENSPTEES